MPIAPLMQRFVDDELARAAATIEQLRLEAVEQLRTHKADGSATGRQQIQLGHDVATVLQQHASRYGARFMEALRDEVATRLAGTPAAALSEAARPVSAPALALALADDSALALLDETAVEADIELSRAAMVLDAAVEWEQRELQTFTSALRGEAHVGPDSNPFSPLT